MLVRELLMRRRFLMRRRRHRNGSSRTVFPASPEKHRPDSIRFPLFRFPLSAFVF